MALFMYPRNPWLQAILINLMKFARGVHHLLADESYKDQVLLSLILANALESQSARLSNQLHLRMDQKVNRICSI